MHKALAGVAGYSKADAARKLLYKPKTDAPLLSMIPIVVVKKDGHPAAHIGSLDEDEDGRLHKQLDQTIGFYQPFLMHTLSKLRERYSPSVDQIVEFLCLSLVFTNEPDSLLNAGLEAYWNHDFVKAIHVLVPQVESILRNFLGSLGIPTLKTVGNLGTMDAKNMNDVLSDDRMRQVLTENLWRYLSVVYVDKRGMNLRNDYPAFWHFGLPPFNRLSSCRTDFWVLRCSIERSPTECFIHYSP